MKRPVSWRPLTFIALVAAIAALPTLTPGFIHDDHRIIEQNELIRDPSRLGSILSKGYWSVGQDSVPNLYRPVTILSFALNHAVGGLAPFGYRLVNLALHVLVTLLVFTLAQRVLPPDYSKAAPESAWIAALIFAVHPVHTEVLGEVVGRAELLAAVGSLACVLGFLRGRDRSSATPGGSPWGWYSLALAGFVLGFLAKESAVVSPALALAADLLIVRRRPAWAFHATAGVVLALCLALRSVVLGGLNPPGFVHPIDNPIAFMPFMEGRLTAMKVIARYALLLCFPLRMSIDYSFDAIPAAAGLLEAPVMLGGALVLGWVVATASCWRRSPATAFTILWLGVALAPTSNLLIPIGTIMAERLLYLPSVGFCMLAGAMAARLVVGRDGAQVDAARKGRVRLVIAIVIVLLGARSVARLMDWRDDYTIFRKAVEVYPESVRALFNYGSAVESRGDDDAAIRAYRRALEVYPPFADAHYNLAAVHSRRGELDDALLHYERALREQPGNVQYLVNLAHTLNAMNRSEEAIGMLQRAIALDPTSDRAFTNLGAAHLSRGDNEEALRAYREAVRLDPLNADYFLNLGLAEERVGNREEALDAYRKGLAIRPGDAALQAALGILLLEVGDATAAAESLRAAVAANPKQPMFHYQLGRALEESGRLPEALAAYREATGLAPKSAVPFRSLGLLLYRSGDREGALQALERCATLDTDAAVMDGESRRVLGELRRSQAGDN